MKNIIYILCIVFSICLFFPQELASQIEYKIDSIQKFNWDNTLEWQLQVRDHYSYSNGGYDFTSYYRLQKDDNTSQWLNIFHQIRTFNSDNNLDTEILQFWDNGQWKDNSKITYSYDSNENNDAITHYIHEGNDWSLKGRQLMIYNSNDLIVESISQEWNLNTLEFENLNRSINTYKNNLISESIFQLWDVDTNMYENKNKSVNSYEGDLLMQKDSYNWNETEWNTSPVNSAIYTYIGILIKTLKIQVDYGSGLKNQLLTIYDYLNNKPVEIIQQIWEETGGGNFNWVNSNQQLYTYDINGQIGVQISSIWGPSSTWELDQKSMYFVSKTLSMTSKNSGIGEVYPNPFNNELNISLKSALEHDGILLIFDVHGKQISKIELRQGVKSIKLNNSYLANGLYFIKLSSGSQTYVLKVIKK
jgi:hypothetical protein